MGDLLNTEYRMQTQAKIYCIIGDPVYQSLSPGMQNAAFNALGLNCSYIAFWVPPAELKESIESLRAIKISGFNVTVPHKIDVINHLDELDASAKKVRAVNTVNNIEGILKGYNTDVHGFIEPLHRRGIKFAGMKVLLLGAGGAARAVIAGLSDEKGISRLIISNRTEHRAAQLGEMARDLGFEYSIIKLQDARNVSKECDLIVNASSMGMGDGESIIDYEHIRKDSIVYDIVHKPVRTNLLENAKYAGATVIYGYEMLLEQGAKAFEIWTGIPAPRDVMKKNLLGMYGEPV